MLFNIFNNKVIESNFDSIFSNEFYNKIEQVRDEFKFPSLQVSIILNDSHFSCSTGFSNIEKKKKANINSVYYLGSVSKVFVKGILLKLLQDNKISLDDSISKYINLSPHGKDVTLKHLLHHKSGLYDPLGAEVNRSKIFDLGKRWTIDEILSEVRNNESYFEAGTNYRYTNIDYILLGKVAEVVSKMEFSRLLREYYLSPLKLDKIYYSVVEKLPKSLALGYDAYDYKPRNGDEMVNIQQCPIFLPTTCFMSGALVGNSLNVCEFFHELFEGIILSDKSKRTARLFFGTKQFGEIIFREQTGYIPGYKSFCGYSSSHKLSVTFLANYTDGHLIYDAVEQILDFFVNFETIRPLIRNNR